MPGTLLFDPFPTAFVDGYFIPAIVYKYINEQYLPMPNLRLISDQRRDQLTPPVARYRYVFDDSLPFEFPKHFEEVLDLQAGGSPYVVQPDDRILAFLPLEDGTMYPLADGFAQRPHAATHGDEEQVVFECFDVSVRCWDWPIFGIMQRDGAHPEDVPNTDPGADVNLHSDIGWIGDCIFNPDGRPNRVKETRSTLWDFEYYPFVDVLIVRDPEVREHWTLPEAVRYILVTQNGEQEYVRLPDLDALENILVSFKPKSEQGTFDPENPETYDVEPIRVPSVNVGGDAWPDAIAKLIEPYGFMARFILEPDHENPYGLPIHRVVIERRDVTRRYRQFFMQRPGDSFDFNWTNVAQVDIHRDGRNIENQWRSLSNPDLIEISVILSPAGWEPGEAVDATPAGRAKFDSTHTDFTKENNYEKYRKFRAGEAGDKIFDRDTETLIVKTIEWQPVFDPERQEGDRRNFVVRRRPGRADLLTKDALGRPYQTQLWVSTDYAGPAPAIWDHKQDREDNVHWQQIRNGAGWRLLDDELGFVVTAREPWSWQIGDPAKDAATGAAFSGGVIDLIRCYCAPSGPFKWPTFRLVTVVEADICLIGVANRRPASSPTRFAVTRYDDTKDRFARWVVDTSSGLSREGETWTIRDDQEAADAHAIGRRRAAEGAPFAGAITVPYITLAYDIGDTVIGIQPRGVDFNAVLGQYTEEAPQWPRIVAVDRMYEPTPATVFHLHDRRAEPDAGVRFTMAGRKKDIRLQYDMPMPEGMDPASAPSTPSASAGYQRQSAPPLAPEEVISPDNALGIW